MLGSCAINKVILMGRLTRDPEMRQSQSGTMVCRFTIAVDRNLSSAATQNGAERQTDFINVSAFNKNAEFVSKYFTKGKLILVEGSLKTGSYNDTRYPDVKHFTTDVWADNVSFGETKSASGGGGYQGGYQQGGYPNGGYQNNGGYQGGYQQGGYQGGYQDNAPQPLPQGNQSESVSVGQLSEFEEIISDNDNLPF